MIVRWSDVAFTIEPGIHTCRGARLKIDPAHIDAWKADPDTAFLGRPEERSRELVYVLTTDRKSSPGGEGDAGPQPALERTLEH
jgi:hypothetical protein